MEGSEEASDGRKSRLFMSYRKHSRPRVFEEDMYFSEPELCDRMHLPERPLARAASNDLLGNPQDSSRASSGVFFVRYQTSGGQGSVTPSEDEDGTLFKTLLSGDGEAGADPSPFLKSKESSSTLGAEIGGPVRPRLREYLKLPLIIEYVINHGILVCLSALLYELTLMPLSGVKGVVKWTKKRSMTSVEKSDLVRTLILFVAVWLFNASIDFSAVYHYVRAQSLLKLYFIFNMLEILERLVRSWGNDLVDGLVLASMGSRKPSWMMSVSMHWIVVLVYSLLHAYMHFWRVMIISVAILTNDIMIVLVTNNFNELKGTVFKKAEARSVYPVVTSDIVERLYLFIDVALVLFRMATSPQRSKMPFSEVFIWAGVMIALEVLTDWLKFLCISKFNQVDNATFWHYNRVHKDDLLHSVSDKPIQQSSSSPLAQKGFLAAPHLPVRRMNFMPTPLAVLILCNVMLPNLVGADLLTLWTYRALVVSFLFLAKFTVDWVLIGDSARSNNDPPLPEKLQNIRSL